ncbi:MAG: hypothetical protein AB7L92_08795 [Alphaproteobacteria bacterium]
MTTLLEAGYYQILAANFPLEVQRGDSMSLEYNPDMAYLLQLKPGKSFTPPEAYKGGFASFADPHEKTRRYLLIRPDRDSTLSVDKEIIESAKRLGFMVTPTQRQTLEYGLEHYGKQANRMGIMVNDVGLPPGVSDNLRMLLPESYEAVLKSHGVADPLMLSERKGRNNISKAVDQQIRKIGASGHTAQSEYERTGYVVGHSQRLKDVVQRGCANGDLVISSPSFLDNKPEQARNDIALVRDSGEQKTVPSCGVFEAGKIAVAAKNGVDHIIAVYHSADDETIRYKNTDGAFIHAWLHPDSNLTYTQVTLFKQPGTDIPGVFTDKLNAADLHGDRSTSYEGFLEELRESGSPMIPITSGRGISISARDNGQGGPGAGCSVV